MTDQSKAEARGDVRGLLAFVALIVLALFASFISVSELPTGSQTDGWRVLGMSWAGGAVATLILFLTVRNPDGSLFTRNPQLIQQNRRRIRRWTGGGGFAILLSLGLVLGGSRGMFLVVLSGAFTGFAMVFFAIVLYAQFIIKRRGLRGP